MANNYYNHQGYPSEGSVAESDRMQAELARVAAGFDKLAGLTNHADTFVVVDSSGTMQVNKTAEDVRGLLDLGTHYTRQPPKLSNSNIKVVRDGQAGQFDYTLVNDDVGKFLQFWVMPPNDTTGNHRNHITIPLLSSMTVGKRIFLLLKATVVDEEQSCTIRAEVSNAPAPTVHAAVHGKVALNIGAGNHHTLLRATFVEDMPAGGSPDPVGGFEASKAVTLICTDTDEYTLYEGLHA